MTTVRASATVARQGAEAAPAPAKAIKRADHEQLREQQTLQYFRQHTLINVGNCQKLKARL